MYIKKLTLKNIKSFKDVTFDFTRPDGSLAGWTVFVGGNGSGKTTVLRAIALALMGPRGGEVILGRNQGWIALPEKRAIATATIQMDPAIDAFMSSIVITTSNALMAGIQWKSITATKSNKSFIDFGPTLESENAKHGPWNPPASGWFAIGYGPMRRLTGNSEDAQYLYEGTGREIRFVTLFEESAALGEGEDWLRRMYARTLEIDRPDRDSINRLVEGVKSLLCDGLLPDGLSISRITVDQVYVVDGRGVELSLDDASDGCRAVLAMVIDITLKLYETYGKRLQFLTDGHGHTVVNLPGVVLIDEAEAHLHPAWQRDLPAWFKTHFPNIQFIVSTHSPLIAQAADPNGLFILPGHGDSESAPRRAGDEELERIRLGTTFHTLLESAFGLYTTRSPWAAEQIAHWQALNAKEKAGVALTKGERQMHTELRRLMDVAFREPDTPVSV